MSSTPAPRRSGARGTRAPIRVTVGQPEEVGGETRLTQSFVLPHPRAAVWQLMSDVEAIARCMPRCLARWPAGRRQGVGPAGGEDRPDRGKLRRRGHATAVRRRVPPGDRGSRRRPAQRLARLGPRRLPTDRARRRGGRGGTRVDVVIGYALTGPLAQIGRCRPGARSRASHRRGVRAEPRCPAARPHPACRRRGSAGCRCCCKSSATVCALFLPALAAGAADRAPHRTFVGDLHPRFRSWPCARQNRCEFQTCDCC